MERTVWTDERLDDRFDRIDERFDRVDRRLETLGVEMGEIRGEIAGLRRDMFHGALVQTGAILTLAGFVVAHSL